MANKQHLKILKQGVEAWNEWRKNNPNIKPNLSNAVIRKISLQGANLQNVNFSYSDLRASDLRNADLRNANLNNINLSDGHLANADFDQADLSEAVLIRANCFNANLRNANLKNAFLGHADLNEASLCNADLRNANLFMAQLDKADLTNANLSNTVMMGAILVGTNLSKANLSNSRVYGISVWNVKLTEAIQENLIISPQEAPVITVDHLEVAQFIYLLLHNEKIRHIIDSIATKVVLILGRFTPKRKAVLNAIRDGLRKHNYIPVLFDFEKPVSRDTHETITTLACLAKFVIADITSPRSITQELVAIVQALPSVPVVPILMKGRKPWGMFDHIKKYPWVLTIHHYENMDDLMATLGEKVIAPAESKASEKKIKVR